MQCTNPLKSGLDYNGNITRNKLLAIKSISFDCRKCLPCRLQQAREKAVRAYHEARIHGHNNIFLTLTYNEESLESPKLIYAHWQTFAKNLRSYISSLNETQKISTMVTGEYGEKNKRPHWHALIFNYRPSDEKYKRTTDRNDTVFTSHIISTLWGRGDAEYGDLTIDSANYTARYAAKKLTHGADGSHDYEPVHRTSSKNAIGKRWIEKYHEHTFSNGFIVLPNGQPSKIPRYYEDWYKKHHPQKWGHYVTHVKPVIQQKAELQARKEDLEYISECLNRNGAPMPLTRSKVKETVLKSKFKRLQERLKL